MALEGEIACAHISRTHDTLTSRGPRRTLTPDSGPAMRPHVRSLAIATLAAAGFAAARPAAAQCYAEPERGFPVFVKSADGAVEDGDFLTAAARAIAFRWQVPTMRRNAFREWSRVKDRLVPPEPRWADDWIPGDEHRAQVAMVLYRDRRLKAAAPKPPSGDELFDNSLLSIAADPATGGPALPGLPSSVKADSVLLSVYFGGDDQAQPTGVVRFAQVQTPATPDRGALEAGGGPPATGSVATSEGGGRGGRGGRGGGEGGGDRGGDRGGGDRGRRAIVKFDVMATGEVKQESIEVLESADAAMTTMIKANLQRARFKPATSNCKPVSLTIVQIF